MGRYTGDDPNESKYVIPTGFQKHLYPRGAHALKTAVPLKVSFFVEKFLERNEILSTGIFRIAHSAGQSPKNTYRA